MAMTHIFFLHGFCGQGNDWQAVLGGGALVSGSVRLNDQREIQCHTPSFFAPDENWIFNNGPAGFASQFNEWVKSKAPDGRRILVGYSMGGRLGLHALVHNPKLWSQAVLISSNPFPLTPVEIHQRRTKNRQWAKRFELESWDSVLAAWNDQPVLKGELVVRNESDFDREKLADALCYCSVSEHLFTPRKLFDLHLSFAWLVGAEDEKYRKMFSDKGELLPGEIHFVQNAGHRLHLERPEVVREVVLSLASV